MSEAWAFPFGSHQERSLVDEVIHLDGPSLVSTAGATTRDIAAPARHFYDLAGRVTVASAVELPELDFCRTERHRRAADITIAVGRVGKGFRTRALVERAPGLTVYHEHLGSLAANFEVDTRDPRAISVVVSPLLGRSPHVVYTNIVEALLRFVLVSRDCALLHSATLVVDGVGVMLSARTDTGKTGTALRLVRERRAKFLSDDMTVLSDDGTAWCYPKPLTISAHTLRTVEVATLNRAERIKLAIQSSVHSKSGRSAGQRLAARNVPIMALNAVAQMIVPPPKFAIGRLLPCDVVSSTPVAHVFFIERGAAAFEDVEPSAMLDCLVSNTDDAYGFPPFEHFAPTIAIDGRDYVALRRREREIIGNALHHAKAWRSTSDTFGWADVIPAVLARLEPVARPRRVSRPIAVAQ